MNATQGDATYEAGKREVENRIVFSKGNIPSVSSRDLLAMVFLENEVDQQWLKRVILPMN
jgi:hypothetical protein